MKRVLVLISISLVAVGAFAQRGPGDLPDQAANGVAHRHMPTNPDGGPAITPMPDEDWYDLHGGTSTGRGVAGETWRLAAPAPLATNLTYHGGDVINTARLVCIFWGPTWATSGSSDNTRAQNIQAFRDQFGTNSHYGIITQYYDSANISATNLHGSQGDWF